MRKLLLLLLLLILVVVLGLLAVGMLVDRDRIQALVAAAVSEELGRELVLAGPVDISLGRTITVSAKDVSLANPDWTQDDQFLQVASLWLEIDTLSLFRGPVIVNEIRLGGIGLDLESRDNGDGNWEFPDTEAADDAGQDAQGFEGLVVVKKLNLESSEVEYTGPLVESPVQLTIHSIKQHLNERDYLVLALRAVLNDEPLTVDMEIGPYHELEALGAVALTASGSVGEIAFSASGSVDRLDQLGNPSAQLQIRGPSFRYLAGLLKLRSEADGPLDVVLSVAPGVDQHHLSLNGSIGTVTVNAEADFKELSLMHATSLKAVVSGDDFAGFEVLMGLAPGQPGPYTFSAEITGDAQEQADLNVVGQIAGIAIRATGSLVARSPTLAGSRVQFSADGPSLASSLIAVGVDGMPEVAFSGVADLLLQADTVIAEQFTVNLGENSLKGRGRLAAGDDSWSVSMPFAASVNNVLQLVPPDSATELPDAIPRVELTGTLEANPARSRLTGLSLVPEGLDLQVSADAQWLTDDPLADPRLTLRVAGDSLATLVRDVPPALASSFTVEAALALSDRRYLEADVHAVGDAYDLRLTPRFDVEDIAAPSRFELEGTIAGSDLRGELLLRPAEPAELRAVLRSERLDLRPWLEGATDQPQATVAADAAGGRLIPDMDIAGIALPSLQAEIDYRAARVETGIEYLQDLVLRADLRDGDLNLREASFVGQGGGTVTGSAGIEPRGEQVEGWLRLTGKNLSAGLPSQDPREVAQLPRYDLSLAYTGTGSTLRNAIAGSHGYLLLSSGEGRVDLSAMRLFTDDFMLSLLNAVNPFASKDPYSNIECSALLMVVENGLLQGKPFLVVQSDRLQVLADLEVDLATEVIKADFNTIPMKGLGLGLSNLVHPYVNVRGTLASPSMGFDAGTALVSGGATVATGGLSILAKGIFDRLSADKRACVSAMAAANKQFERLESLYGNTRPGAASP